MMPWVCLQFVIVVFADHTHYFCYLCLSLPYRHVCFLQPCGNLLRRADLLAFLCVMLSCVFFFHFPILCHGSGVVLDCSLSYFVSVSSLWLFLMVCGFS